MLDSRLAAISRNLTNLSDKIRRVGSKYANMMRQIEVAEANLEGAERDMQRVKARYKRGEVSKGAYGKLMEEYQGRIEAAEASIDGVLLRLRE
jgi:chromosome segregation ATPase